jgi:hypothetical protein
MERESHGASRPFVAGALRIRCGMKDCPGELGRAARQRYMAGMGCEPYDFFVYQAPRGFVKLAETDHPVYALSRRARAMMRQGLPPRGRRTHSGRGDWDSSRELRPYDLPGETYGLDEGAPVGLVCPVCNRTWLLRKADVRVELDERYGNVIGY